jgi:hypothetical protein
MAPMINCATVPTTISDKAVEILNQIARTVAMGANPTQTEASAQTFCMSVLAPVLVLDSCRGHDSATRFLVRSHHLSRLKRTAVRGRPPSPLDL